MKNETLDIIKQAVCEVKGISEEDFAIKCRKRIYAEPRQLFCLITKRYGFISEEIANYLHQDQGTVRYGAIHAEDMINKEMRARNDYLEILKKLENGFNFRINVDNN